METVCKKRQPTCKLCAREWCGGGGEGNIVCQRDDTVVATPERHTPELPRDGNKDGNVSKRGDKSGGADAMKRNEGPGATKTVNSKGGKECKNRCEHAQLVAPREKRHTTMTTGS